MVCIFLIFNIRFKKLELSLTKTIMRLCNLLVINLNILLFNNNIPSSVSFNYLCLIISGIYTI